MQVLHPLSLSSSVLAVLAHGLAAQTPEPVLGADLKLPGGALATELVAPRWDPEHQRDTCKVFHHVRAPDGTLLTKGNGGRFEHHKGLFVGWNHTRWRQREIDFWHLPKRERQVLRSFVPASELDLPKGAQVARVDWLTSDGECVVAEWRGLALAATAPDHYVLHLRNKLTAPAGDVHLAGDPQHSGQQFRSPQCFADKGAAPVLYVRPDGAKEQGNDVWTNCDWIAAVQRYGDKTFTILRIEGPRNPGAPTWSTRPYGRFGATRAITVTRDRPLVLDQYYVVANGARDAAWCSAQARRWRGHKARR
ncbi:MAG TPA: hypothetical protein ENI87_00850 [bacterium]|nr:hypothetical protein [bacterium]